MATSVTTGTHDISSLFASRNQSVVEFGIDNVNTILQNDLAAHNLLVQDMFGEFAEFSSDRQRIYGASVSGDMVEVDEYGRSATQKPSAGSTVGFPMKLFQYAIGWTEKWMQTHTPNDMALAQQGAKMAHLRRLQLEVKKALLLSSNYTWVDFLVDGVSLSVKRLVNADSQAIPDGPNGEQFTASSHTHYLARVSTLAVSDGTGLINTVLEHGHGGRVKIAINAADEAAWRALTGTGGFQALSDPRLIYRNTDTPGQTLDISRTDNRQIGLFGAAELWVKPWVPANYALCWDSEGPKPLLFRQRSQATLQGLRIAATNSAYPLTAQYVEDEFGIGVWNRTNGAVLYTGGTSYTDPTL